MKKYQARKAISVLLTLLMLMSSVYLGLGVIASAAAPEEVAEMEATALEAGKVYTVTRNTTIEGSASSNGMTVAANTTVIIDIAEGVTLTVKGGSASGQTAGKAGAARKRICGNPYHAAWDRQAAREASAVSERAHADDPAGA